MDSSTRAACEDTTIPITINKYVSQGRNVSAYIGNNVICFYLDIPLFSAEDTNVFPRWRFSFGEQ